MKNSNSLNMPDKANHYRGILVEVITQELYPETEFPAHLFPDLTQVLTNFFYQVFNNRNPVKENGENIHRLVRDILDFKNILENSPQTMVMLYRTCIKKFIYFKHARSGSMRDEWEDIFQEVVTRLISGKMLRIQEKYDFSYGEGIKKTNFTSYLMVCVRNIYMDIIRERQVRPLTAGELHSLDDARETHVSEDKNMLNHLIVEEEFRKFHTLLALHYRSRFKLELCLKLRCRIPLVSADIYRCFPTCSNDEVKTLSGDFRDVKDKSVFDAVIPVFNRHEGHENKSDTLRKWLSLKVDEILDHMNRTHQCIVYTAKNVFDFITLYYERVNPQLEGDGGKKNGNI